MRAKVGFAAVWVATTAAGIAISWAGVGDAMRGTTSSPLELAAGTPVRPPTPLPSPTSAKDELKPPSSPPSTSTSPSPSTDSSARANPDAGRSSSPPPRSSSNETIRTYKVRHGRVTVALGRDSARLVSATPDSGFKVMVWRKPTWLRVDMQEVASGGQHGSAVFVTWGDHPPLVQVHEY